MGRVFVIDLKGKRAEMIGLLFRYDLKIPFKLPVETEKPHGFQIFRALFAEKIQKNGVIIKDISFPVIKNRKNAGICPGVNRNPKLPSTSISDKRDHCFECGSSCLPS